MEHLSKTASVFWKAGKILEKHPKQLDKIPSSRLQETSTGRLIFSGNKKKDKLLFDALQSREKNEQNTLTDGPENW